jgi:hypothetical protein
VHQFIHVDIFKNNKYELIQEGGREREHTNPSRLPTMIEPTESYIAFPVICTVTKDAPAIASPVTAAPSYRAVLD